MKKIISITLVIIITVSLIYVKPALHADNNPVDILNRATAVVLGGILAAQGIVSKTVEGQKDLVQAAWNLMNKELKEETKIVAKKFITNGATAYAVGSTMFSQYGSFVKRNFVKGSDTYVSTNINKNAMYNSSFFSNTSKIYNSFSDKDEYFLNPIVLDTIKILDGSPDTSDRDYKFYSNSFSKFYAISLQRNWFAHEEEIENGFIYDIFLTMQNGDIFRFGANRYDKFYDISITPYQESIKDAILNPLIKYINANVPFIFLNDFGCKQVIFSLDFLDSEKNIITRLFIEPTEIFMNHNDLIFYFECIYYDGSEILAQDICGFQDGFCLYYDEQLYKRSMDKHLQHYDLTNVPFSSLVEDYFCNRLLGGNSICIPLKTDYPLYHPDVSNMNRDVVIGVPENDIGSLPFIPPGDLFKDIPLDENIYPDIPLTQDETTSDISVSQNINPTSSDTSLSKDLGKITGGITSIAGLIEAIKSFIENILSKIGSIYTYLTDSLAKIISTLLSLPQSIINALTEPLAFTILDFKLTLANKINFAPFSVIMEKFTYFGNTQFDVRIPPKIKLPVHSIFRSLSRFGISVPAFATNGSFYLIDFSFLSDIKVGGVSGRPVIDHLRNLLGYFLYIRTFLYMYRKIYA